MILIRCYYLVSTSIWEALKTLISASILVISCIKNLQNYGETCKKLSWTRIFHAPKRWSKYATHIKMPTCPLQAHYLDRGIH